jgi:predicted nuclease with TOPRIM domain
MDEAVRRPTLSRQANHNRGVDPLRGIDWHQSQFIDGIRALHDKHALPSPIDTPVVRAEIWRLLIRAGRDEPRWSTEEMALFDTLDDAVKEVIVRRAALDSKEVRKAQNEAADLRHKLKQLENELAQLRAATKETEK